MRKKQRHRQLDKKKVYFQHSTPKMSLALPNPITQIQRMIHSYYMTLINVHFYTITIKPKIH